MSKAKYTELPTSLDQYPEVRQASAVLHGLRNQLDAIQQRMDALQVRLHAKAGNAEIDNMARQLLAGSADVAVLTADRRQVASEVSIELADLEEQQRILEAAAQQAETAYMAAAGTATRQAAATVTEHYKAALQRLADAIIEFRRAHLAEKQLRDRFSEPPIKVFPQLCTPAALFEDFAKQRYWLKATVEANLLPAEYSGKLG